MWADARSCLDAHARSNDPERVLPDVSIIVPCYNAADTLPHTLASIRAQTLPNWEAVCVDDGSTDATVAILADHAAQDARIRWTHGPHRCPAAARNAGVALARAARVLFLDADDSLRPAALEVLLQAAATAGADDTLISAGYELLDEQGVPLGVLRFPGGGLSVDTLLLGNRLPAMTLVPRTLLGEQPFDEDPRKRGCEDWDLWLRLAGGGAACVTLPRVLFGYRQRARSLSHDADRMLAAGRLVLERWSAHARDPQVAAEAAHRLAWSCGAVACASGAPAAIERYLHALPPVEVSDSYRAAVAGAIRDAYAFVGGAHGHVWTSKREDWLGEIRPWLEGGPLAAWAAELLERVWLLAIDPCENLADVTWLLRRRGARRLVVYGLGSNGLALLEALRAAPPGGAALAVADDHADQRMFAFLALPREDPREWPHWPEGTVAVVTPNACEPMVATLVQAGGREGVDFIAPARRARARVMAGAGAS